MSKPLTAKGTVWAKLVLNDVLYLSPTLGSSAVIVPATSVKDFKNFVKRTYTLEDREKYYSYVVQPRTIEEYPYLKLHILAVDKTQTREYPNTFFIRGKVVSEDKGSFLINADNEDIRIHGLLPASLDKTKVIEVMAIRHQQFLLLNNSIEAE